jgi:hypothetical protein
MSDRPARQAGGEKRHSRLHTRDSRLRIAHVTFLPLSHLGKGGLFVNRIQACEKAVLHPDEDNPLSLSGPALALASLGR